MAWRTSNAVPGGPCLGLVHWLPAAGAAAARGRRVDFARRPTRCFRRPGTWGETTYRRPPPARSRPFHGQGREPAADRGPDAVPAWPTSTTPIRLRLDPGVDFAFRAARPTPIPRAADVVVLLGTKSTVGELRFLRAQGWDHDIIAHARSGGTRAGRVRRLSDAWPPRSATRRAWTARQARPTDSGC